MFWLIAFHNHAFELGGKVVELQNAAQVSRCDVIELTEFAECEIGILFKAFVHAVGFRK